MVKNIQAFALILMLSILTTASGCSGATSRQTEAAKESLEQKYGEEFTIIDSRSDGAGGSYVWASPEANQEIVFHADTDDSGAALSDNYVIRKLCEDLTDKAEDVLTGYNGNVYVFTENRVVYATADDADITIQKYLADNPGDAFYISIFTEEGADLDSLYDQILNIKAELVFVRGSVDTFVIPKGQLLKLQSKIEEYDEMDQESVQEIISEGRKTYVNLSPGAPAPSREEYLTALGR